MKTTIEIPEALYKKAKIRAVEKGLTLKDVFIASLERELSVSESSAGQASFWQKRTLHPDFVRYDEAGAFVPRSGNPDVTEGISGDRDAR